MPNTIPPEEDPVNLGVGETVRRRIKRVPQFDPRACCKHCDHEQPIRHAYSCADCDGELEPLFEVKYEADMREEEVPDSVTEPPRDNRFSPWSAR